MSNASDSETLKTHYLDVFRRNRAAILDASGQGFEPPIKGCPGWDVAGLTGHMGRVYTFWLKWVRERPRELSREAYDEILRDRDTRLAGYNAWEAAGFPKDSRPDGIDEYARHAGDDLDAALAGLEPEETVWTFVPTRRTGAFVLRRLAMETTVHRWDAEEAQGIAAPIEAVLARDGVDEMLMLYREDPAYRENAHRRRGQRVLLREDEGPGRWLVTFDSGGVSTSHGEEPADATVRGSASDLMLFTQGRLNPDELHIEGDGQLVASWGDLAGRF